MKVSKIVERIDNPVALLKAASKSPLPAAVYGKSDWIGVKFPQIPQILSLLRVKFPVKIECFCIGMRRSRRSASHSSILSARSAGTLRKTDIVEDVINGSLLSKISKNKRRNRSALSRLLLSLSLYKLNNPPDPSTSCSPQYSTLHLLPRSSYHANRNAFHYNSYSAHKNTGLRRAAWRSGHSPAG